MKTIPFFSLLLIGMACLGQSRVQTAETFLGVPVVMHHTTVLPGDTVRLPAYAYVKEVLVVGDGDYTVYNTNGSFTYPDNRKGDRIVHRNEGSFEVEGQIMSRAFEPLGQEQHADVMITSSGATVHVYYFTLIKEERKLALSVPERLSR